MQTITKYTNERLANDQQEESQNIIPASGSESSSSDDGVKAKKRRSHRPRGCRGGGSRRARKQRREHEFLVKKARENNLAQLAVMMSYNQHNHIHNGKEMIEIPIQQLQRIHYHGQATSNYTPANNNIPINSYTSDVLHKLQVTSSYTSGCSSEATRINNIDILPTLHTAQNSDPTCVRYKTMNALPPRATHKRIDGNKSVVANQHLTQRGNIENSTPVSMNSISSHVVPARKHKGKNVHKGFNSGSSESKTDLNHISDPHSNTVERIKKQQEMLSEGGSFFAISPRSFLFGKKQAPKFSF